jgi:hypothetical protein
MLLPRVRVHLDTDCIDSRLPFDLHGRFYSASPPAAGLLSGSELNGTALVDGARLQLRFPARPEIIGQFVSRTELRLRLNDSGPDYTLTKRDR